jgi:hypothetical protein
MLAMSCVAEAIAQGAGRKRFACNVVGDVSNG